jgi:geranylgeranyl pyrophosphate synthase
LIVLFRDPAKLVYSFYWNSVREGHEPLPFKEALLAEEERMARLQHQLERNGQILYAYSRVAAYAQQLKPYLTYFPKENFLFFLTDDLINYPSVVSKLQTFLEVEDYSTKIKPSNNNVSAMPKSRKLHQWLRNRSLLKEIFKPLIPMRVRYKLKMSTLEMNLKEFTPPEMDEEIANSIRQHFSQETKQLQDLIQRDLSRWLPA